MTDYSMTIGGRAVETEATFGVRNPATGEVFAQAPECSRAQLDAAMASAASAYAEWKADEELRRDCLRRMAAALKGAVNDLGALITSEQGKPLGDAYREVIGASRWLEYYADLERPREVIQDDARAVVEVVRRPLGVVSAITPWNFPLLLAFWKIAPALLAGNTLVLKPSPFTPLTTLKVGELLREVFSPGVLNII